MLARGWMRRQPTAWSLSTLENEALSRFTPREQDVLKAVCEGATNDELAKALHLSVSTVKGHITSLMQKTETSSRANLVIWAYRNTNISP